MGTTPAISLIKAAPADVDLIHRLAVTIWNRHYPSIIGQPQVDYMLERSYSASSLRAQLEQPSLAFFLVRDGEQVIGFVAVETRDDGSVWIDKFYLEPGRWRQGSGSAAWSQLREQCPASVYRLAVNRRNYPAINFYFKNGFVIESLRDLEIGGGFFMNDFIMIWRSR